MERIVRFVSTAGEVRSGVLIDDQTARPWEGPVWQLPATLGEPVRVARLLAPVEPPNIFAIGRNYRAHADETGAGLPQRLLVFGKPTTAVQHPGGPIVLPAVAPDRVDYEAELAIVIGRAARHVPREQALDCVLGYTCANDVSARDCQKADKQWTRAKGFDTFCPLGPWIVPAAQFDPSDRRICCRLNGRTMQDARTSEMIWDCAALISELSQAFTLLPGTVILTGTPAGVGFVRQPPVFLRAGDEVEVEIEGLGVLRNHVVAEEAGSSRIQPE